MARGCLTAGRPRLQGLFMTDLFREVDEALREDRAKAIWTRYGRLIVGLAALLVLGTATYVYWQNYRVARDVELSGALAVALAQAEANPAAAADALAAIGE